MIPTLQALQERVEVLEAGRDRQRGGSLQANGMPMKQEMHANGINGSALPAMSISSPGLHHSAPCHNGQVQKPRTIGI